LARVNLILLLVLTACALGLVTSRHQARKLFAELEQEQERAKQLDVEWGQLQLEQSTWAMHARVEKVARERLRMRVPDATRTQLVMPGAVLGAQAGVKR
jgi:cell division protein FtsL